MGFGSLLLDWDEMLVYASVHILSLVMSNKVKRYLGFPSLFFFFFGPDGCVAKLPGNLEFLNAVMIVFDLLIS